MKGKSCSYDYSFKILLIGDSGVGKSTILLSFISNSAHALSPTIGVDFKAKTLNVGGKRLKLTIWDTAGQERFGILTSSYYRGAHGIILVYDVTRRESFLNLTDIWAKEVELYSTNPECIKLLVGNKVDRDTERAVSREEGMALAWERKYSFFECSAKTRQNVQQCFIELVRRLVRTWDQIRKQKLSILLGSHHKRIFEILEAPALLEKGSMVGKQQILKQKQEYQAHHSSGCCS